MAAMAAKTRSRFGSHGCQNKVTFWQPWVPKQGHVLTVMAAKTRSRSGSHGCQNKVPFWQTWLPEQGHVLAVMAARTRSLFFLMTEATMAAVVVGSCPVQYENARTSDPATRGYPAHSVRPRAARGSFGIDTHGYRSDFCDSVFF